MAARPNPLAALPDADFGYWQAHRLLARAGFGGTPEATRLLASRGLNNAVDSTIYYTPWMPPEADLFNKDLRRPLTKSEQAELSYARESGDEDTVERFRRVRQANQRADRKQLTKIRDWWFDRILTTPNPFEEKMTLFWHGHFATGFRTIEDSWHMYAQNQLLRSHATGNFAELCTHIIHDPAMLKYLDSDQNRKGSPNENFARELMELFVLGEGNDYTETDIKEGARALTGYSFKDNAFIFNASQHDDGMKHILGSTGRYDGEDFLRIILSRKAASEFICQKLVRFFINDAPGAPTEDTKRVIRGLGSTLRHANFKLRPMLQQLFKSRFFYEESNEASIVKSPIQLIAQAVRTLGVPSRDHTVLLGSASLMGQHILEPPSVKGWDGGRSWINTATLFVRQNVLVYLLTGRLPEGSKGRASTETFDAMPLIAHLRADRTYDPGVVSDYLLQFCLGAAPHEARRTQLRAYFASIGDRVDNGRLLGALALITAMPEYQLC